MSLSPEIHRALGDGHREMKRLANETTSDLIFGANALS